MRVIQPYARTLLTNFEEFGAMRHIEWCARISHRSEEDQKIDSWRRFIESVVIKHGDWSVTEHVSVSVDAVMDRGISHEWVRHRHPSYTQESTRFVNYEKKMPPSFIYPQVGVVCRHCESGNEPTVSGTHYWPASAVVETCAYDSDWLWLIGNAESTYRKLLTKKWRPQEARSVFPTGLATRVVTTANLRSWRHFFIMRTTLEAHPQIRQIAEPLLKTFQMNFPLLYDDIKAGSRQIDNLRLPE